MRYIAAVTLVFGLVVASLVNAATLDRCVLSNSDKIANAALDFESFDQQGALPSSGRALAERKCFAAAALAWEDYLVRGPVAKASQRSAMMFHLGQMLASAGDERAAARAVIAARSPTPTGDLDWNSNVEGTWAFLTKDKALLKASRDRVSARSGEGNAMNAMMLDRLYRCFNLGYDAAYDACAPKTLGN